MLVLPINRARGSAASPAAPRLPVGTLGRPLTRAVLVTAGVLVPLTLLADLRVLTGVVANVGPYLGAVALMAFTAALAARRPGPARRAWALLALAGLFLLLGELTYTYLTGYAGSDGILTPADAFYALAYALWVAGLLSLRRGGRSHRDIASIDALIVAVSAAAALTVLGIHPGFTLGASVLEVVVNLAYPVAGLVAFWLILGDAYRHGVRIAAWRSLLAAGLLLYTLCELWWLFTLTDAISLPWVAAALLMAAAAPVAADQDDGAPAIPHRAWHAEVVPTAAFAIFVITCAAHVVVTGGGHPWVIVGALIAVFSVVVARLAATVGQNRALIAERERRAVQLDAAREAAEEAAEARVSFVATMSHELRTPLNAVIGGSELLRDEQFSTPEQRRLARMIANAGDMLLAVINGVLDFTRLEAGGVQLEAVPFDPREVVVSAIDAVADSAAAKGLEVRAIVDPALPERLLGDPARLRQIVLNLLSNAVKFTGEGHIDVHASGRSARDCWELELAVADTGPGISSEEQARLFSPFEQASAATNREHGGTGLGLAISRALAELMGGQLEVESAPGAGATFLCRVPLPLAAAAEVPPEAELAAPPASGRALRVLVVEDEPVNRQLAGDMLRRIGHQAHQAESGPDALHALAREHFDAVLLDLRMPAMDGFEVAERIRLMADDERPRLVALSGDGDAQTRQRCRNAGFDDHLTKPVRLEDLLRALPATDDVALAPPL